MDRRVILSSWRSRISALDDALSSRSARRFLVERVVHKIWVFMAT